MTIKREILLCPKSPSKLWLSFRSGVQPPTVIWPSSVQSVTPLLYHFCLFVHIPVPDSAPPCVSCFRCSFCFMSPAPNPIPNPEPCSVLLCITSPCSIFVPMLFYPNPCPFPSTLLCSFRYLYVDSFLYVPQSEINVPSELQSVSSEPSEFIGTSARPN